LVSSPLIWSHLRSAWMVGFLGPNQKSARCCCPAGRAHFLPSYSRDSSFSPYEGSSMIHNFSVISRETLVLHNSSAGLSQMSLLLLLYRRYLYFTPRLCLPGTVCSIARTQTDRRRWQKKSSDKNNHIMRMNRTPAINHRPEKTVLAGKTLFPTDRISMMVSCASEDTSVWTPPGTASQTTLKARDGRTWV